MDCVKIGQFIAKRRRELAIRKMPLRKGWEYPTRLFLINPKSFYKDTGVLCYITPVSFDYFEF